MEGLTPQYAKRLTLKREEIMGSRALQTETNDLVGDSARHFAEHLVHPPSDPLRISRTDLDRRKRDDRPTWDRVEGHVTRFEIDGQEPFLVGGLAPWIQSDPLQRTRIAHPPRKLRPPMLTPERHVVPLCRIDEDAFVPSARRLGVHHQEIPSHTGVGIGQRRSTAHHRPIRHKTSMQAEPLDLYGVRPRGHGIDVRKCVEYGESSRVTRSARRVTWSGDHQHPGLRHRGIHRLQAPGKRHHRARRRVWAVEDITSHDHDVGSELDKLPDSTLEGGRDITLSHVRTAIHAPVGPESEVQVGKVCDDHEADPPLGPAVISSLSGVRENNVTTAPSLDTSSFAECQSFTSLGGGSTL